MRLHHVIERFDASGTIESSAVEHAQPVLRAGRSSLAELILDSPVVSPLHALFRVQESALFIEDLDSRLGVRVNGRSVLQAPLRHGDTVKLGDVTLRVEQTPEAWLLIERRETRAAQEPGESRRRTVRRLDVATHMPPLGLLSGLLAAAVSVALFSAPLLAPGRIDRTLWSSGPLSNPHRFLEGDCERCHTTPFRRVDEKRCLGCHTPKAHANVKDPGPGTQCSSCHVEHRGSAALLPSGSWSCTGCHGREEGSGGTARERVRDFARHPPFAVRRPAGDPRNGRSSLEAVRFNHKSHLDALREGSEPPSATCVRCHDAQAERRSGGTGLVPVSYAANCSSCHPLSLAGPLEGVEVTHADPATVTSQLVAVLARHYLGLAPGRASGVGTGVPGRLEDVRRRIEEELQRAESSLYASKTLCDRCHAVREKAEVGPGQSRYDIVRPLIPARWFPAAHFEHGAHRFVPCETCHASALRSETASDVLLPGIEVCLGCHGDQGTPRKLESPCAMCHNYHGSHRATAGPSQGVAKPDAGSLGSLGAR